MASNGTATASTSTGIMNLPNQVRPCSFRLAVILVVKPNSTRSSRTRFAMTNSGTRLVRIESYVPGRTGPRLWLTPSRPTVAKRGGHFTLMVVGESGLGKTTLV